MNKKELRKIFLQKRKELTQNESANHNRLLQETFFSRIDIAKFKVIHIYLPILKFNEPDTFLIIDHIQKNFSEVTILIPYTNQKNNQLQNCIFTRINNLKNNKWEIPEPEDPVFTDLEPDLVIVPLLAFDKKGFRVGYGKGFYDRYFANLKKTPLKVGLSFFEPVDIIDDIDPYDIPMDKCIVLDKVYNF